MSLLSWLFGYRQRKKAEKNIPYSFPEAKTPYRNYNRSLRSTDKEDYTHNRTQDDFLSPTNPLNPLSPFYIGGGQSQDNYSSDYGNSNSNDSGYSGGGAFESGVGSADSGSSSYDSGSSSYDSGSSSSSFD